MRLIEPETILETPRLLLEPLQVRHALALYEPLQSPIITASIKLVEFLGFQQVATRLNADFFKGSTSHEYRYELLARWHPSCSVA